MTVRLSSKLARYEHEGVLYYSHWCAACAHAHTFTIGGGRGWEFDGNVERPTFSPSMREFLPARKDHHPERTLCHYVLTAGVMNYCPDSPHALSGQSVPLDDIPADYGFGGQAFGELEQA